jgi:hypothetical protein
MAQTKYVTLSKLSIFLDNLANKFSLKSHTHKAEDVIDYTVDDQLSVISTNPVQNKAVSDEFEAVGSAISALELLVDGKSDDNHVHDIYYTKSETDNLELISVEDIDDICGSTI